MAAKQGMHGRILIVDDDSDFALSLLDILESRDYQVEMAHSVHQGVEKAKDFDPQVALLDIRLNKGNGLDLLVNLKKIRPGILCIMMTAYVATETAVEALNEGAYAYLRKPIDVKDLLSTLERCFDKIRLETEKYQAEAALQESENMYRTLVENLPQRIFLKNQSSVYLSCNENFAKDFGVPRLEVHGKTDYDFYPDQFAKQIIENDKKIIQSGKSSEQEEILNIRGSESYVQIVKTPIKDESGRVNGILGIFWDITNRKQAEDKIMASLKEKEVLLKEIHHRVKNNLQVISSLLNLQSRYIHNAEAQSILEDSRNRVRSMALVHEELYRSENFAEVDFKEYIHHLSLNLFRAYNTDPGKICLEIKVEKVSLAVDMAVPCGLIINELITNSLKHAFPSSYQGKGKVLIQLKMLSEEEVELSVEDNGVGVPQDFNVMTTDSLGMYLVRLLSEEQLQGKLSVEQNKGLRFSIRFPTVIA